MYICEKQKMIANIKYIYDESGEVEAAIVPIQKWRSIEQQIETKSSKASTSIFDPAAFEDILIRCDLDAIIPEMRGQWTDNF